MTLYDQDNTLQFGTMVDAVLSWPRHMDARPTAQEDEMGLWVVGRILEGGSSWGIEAIMSGEKAASALCQDDTWFIGPMTLDQPTPLGIRDWPGAYYPTAREKSLKEDT